MFKNRVVRHVSCSYLEFGSINNLKNNAKYDVQAAIPSYGNARFHTTYKNMFQVKLVLDTSNNLCISIEADQWDSSLNTLELHHVCTTQLEL